MQILSLELENVKSYQRQRIDFTAGLNAICGLNGSGKTTVLESIGFALFDHLPYSQGSFVREGEKSGTIRVRILARDDRPYEVVRRVGASSTYYVADADDGTRVVERRENVLDWIGTQALGIDGGADLAALFKNAVGVPQGTITTDFLGTPAQRKAVFDPLLRVQEYGRANEELRHTVSYLRDLSATTREEIARLETETGRIPDLRRQLEAQQQELKESEARLRDLEKCVAEAELQKQSLDSLEEQINRLGSELELWQSAVQAQEQVWHMQQDGVAAARRAVAVVAETEPGYRAVVAARERLKTLDVERTKRDLLQKELAGAQSNRQGIFGRIEQLDERLRSAGEAAARAATLVEAVREQERLEEQLQQVALARRDAAGLDRQIGERTTELTRIQSEVDSHAERLSQARAAAVEEQQLADVPVRLRDVGDRLARLEPLRRQADEITEEGKRLRLQHDRLAAQSQERLSLLHKIATLQLVATSLDEQIERQARLREEQVRIVSTIDFQEVARAELERANCPLLELRCPVVSTDSGALKAFTARVETLAARLQQVQDELAALVKPLEAAREAFLEVQELRLRAAKLEDSEKQVGEAARQLSECRDRFRVLKEQLDTTEAIKLERADLLAQEGRLRQASSLASQAPLLEKQQERNSERIQTLRREITSLEAQRDALRAVEERAQPLEQELATLGKPKEEQQRLLALAGERQAIEESIKQQQSVLLDAADRVKALTGDLTAFAQLDEQLELQHRVEEENGGDHDRYLSNRDEAHQLQERQNGARAAEEALQAAREQEQGTRRQLEELTPRYDGERHAHLKEKCVELGNRRAEERTHQRHIASDVRESERELSRLVRQEEKLQLANAELARLQRVAQAVTLIRETIKSAGPAITETLLTSISQIANDIFAEIMDDHAAELRWDRDYEVLVQRGAESRQFNQLSGGEQMSAALAVRLALLREMSQVDFAFFDEPTQNMDGERRSNLADQIRAVRGFEQLIVISHDDTFEHHTDNLIRLRKENEQTELEAG